MTNQKPLVVLICKLRKQMTYINACYFGTKLKYSQTIYILLLT